LRVSRVRIPLSPPDFIPMMFHGILKGLNYKGLGFFCVLSNPITSRPIPYKQRIIGGYISYNNFRPPIFTDLAQMLIYAS